MAYPPLSVSIGGQTTQWDVFKDKARLRFHGIMGHIQNWILA